MGPWSSSGGDGAAWRSAHRFGRSGLSRRKTTVRVAAVLTFRPWRRRPGTRWSGSELPADAGGNPRDRPEKEPAGQAGLRPGGDGASRGGGRPGAADPARTALYATGPPAVGRPGGGHPEGWGSAPMNASLTFDNRFVGELPGDPETNERPTPGAGRRRHVSNTGCAAPRFSAHLEERAGVHRGAGGPRGVRRVRRGNGPHPRMEPDARWTGAVRRLGQQCGTAAAITLGRWNPGGKRWERRAQGPGPRPLPHGDGGRPPLPIRYVPSACSQAPPWDPTTRPVPAGHREREATWLNDGSPARPGRECRVPPLQSAGGTSSSPRARDHALLEQLGLSIPAGLPLTGGRGRATGPWGRGAPATRH